MVDGFNHTLKLIKRSSYGQAGFPLIQRRILLHQAHRFEHVKRPVQKRWVPEDGILSGPSA